MSPWWYVAFGVAVLMALGVLAFLFRKIPATGWKAGADAARDWMAIIYIVVLTIYAAWVTGLMVFLYPWKEGTERLRLYFLGTALLMALALIGFGYFYFQRRQDPHLKIRGPGGLNAELGGDASVTMEGNPHVQGDGTGPTPRVQVTTGSGDQSAGAGMAGDRSPAPTPPWLR